MDFRYRAGHVANLNDVYRELQRLQEVVDALIEGRTEILHSAPDKPQQGQRVFADGTDWNPGSGMGAYSYEGTSTASLGWVKL